MNKKANLVLPIIILTLSVILVASLLIPTVKNTVNAFPTPLEYYLVNTTDGASITTTLTHTNVASFVSVTNGSVSLALNTNYTETNGVLLFTNAVYGNYAINYTYYNRSYDFTTGELALFSVVVLGAIIGVVYAVFSMFGLVGGK